MRLLFLLLTCLSSAIAADPEGVQAVKVDLRIDVDERGTGALVRGTLEIGDGAAGSEVTQGLRIDLADAHGHSMLARPLVTAASVRDFSLRIAEVPRWSAEVPVLATLTISVLDPGRATLATKTIPVGFRSVDCADGRVRVNGSPVRLRGVTAPLGFSSAEMREQAILAWKRDNVNALFVPATANPADWLSLCDRFGLYVVTEAPQTAEFEAHPSFLFSSATVAVVSDPATMQAFLRAGARPELFDRPTLVNAALDAPADRPVLAVDLRPAPGELSLFWQEIYWYPRLLGAFLAPSVEVTSAEVKNVYGPVLVERRRMKPGDVVVRVTNRHHHLSLEAYEARWAVLRDGAVVQQGTLSPLPLGPHAQPEVPIPVAPIAAPVPGAAYSLRLVFHTRAASSWAPEGHVIATEELPLEVAVSAHSTH